MHLVFVGPAYLGWHYVSALKSLFLIWRNFVWFTYHFFSVGLLLRTLLSPWRRLDENYKKGSLDVWGWVETLIVNTLMRVVGVIVRLVFILIGIICLVAVSVAVVPLFLIWLALPLIIAGLFISGVILLI